MTVSSAIGSLFRHIGIRASDSDLSNNWESIIGSDLAQKAQLIAVRKTKTNKLNIVIRPTNPAFALQLSYAITDITQKINKYYTYDAIEKITIRK